MSAAIPHPDFGAKPDTGAAAVRAGLKPAPTDDVPATTARDEILTFQRLYTEAMTGPPAAFYRAWCWHAARLLRWAGWS